MDCKRDFLTGETATRRASPQRKTGQRAATPTDYFSNFKLKTKKLEFKKVTVLTEKKAKKPKKP